MTATKVLVAGATGQVGRHVSGELRRRGYTVRALSREASKLESAGVVADELFAGDATRPETMKGICEGVGVVVSALGAPLTVGRSKGAASYREVDYEGNKHLLDEALRAGVEKFVYVSVYGAHLYGQLEYVRAHEDFVRELDASGIDYAVVRPTGFFSSFAELLSMARRGPLALIGEGDKRTNPVHEADVARACVDAIESGARETAIGGPHIYTRKQINELAFAALGKRPRMLKVPARLVALLVGAVRPFDRRLHALLSFLTTVSQIDAVAPATGERSLESYFRELARDGRSPSRR